MMQSQELQAFRAQLHAYRSAPLPPAAELAARVDAALAALAEEPPAYRPQDERGMPGGLLDFIAAPVRPVIIVPDLHARPDFLLRLLDSSIATPSVLDALNAGRLMIVCVGDGIHAETPDRAAPRWFESYREWRRATVSWPFRAGPQDKLKAWAETCAPMREEMQEAWATMAVVLELKAAFPAGFHFLKGNHENILNQSGGGDYAFRKYVLEGDMVYDFMLNVYGGDVLNRISRFEKALPVVAVFPTFAVSHGEPLTSYPREDVINYRRNGREDVVLNFTWTANDEALPGSVRRQFHALNPHADVDASLWFGGHRPVEGTYALRQDGTYIQIHNPMQMNVAVISEAARFTPDEHIVSVL